MRSKVLKINQKEQGHHPGRRHHHHTPRHIPRLLVLSPPFPITDVEAAGQKSGTEAHHVAQKEVPGARQKKEKKERRITHRDEK